MTTSNKMVVSKGRRRNPRARRQQPNAVGQYASDAWSLARRTAAGLNEIRKLINVEHKHCSVTGATTFDRTGTVVYLSGIAQGDDITDREGDSIKVQSASLRFYLYFNTAATIGTGCRILLVRDLQNQGATITAADVLNLSSGITAPTSSPNFINSSLVSNRFSIVMDEFVAIDAGSQTYSLDFKSTHDCHVAYRGTSSAVTSAANGSYFLIAVSSEATNTPSIVYQSRIVFTDN